MRKRPTAKPKQNKPGREKNNNINKLPSAVIDLISDVVDGPRAP